LWSGLDSWLCVVGLLHLQGTVFLYNYAEQMVRVFHVRPARALCPERASRAYTAKK